MSELRSIDVQEVLALAEGALAKISAGVVRPEDVEVLSNDNRRNVIARAVARCDRRRYKACHPEIDALADL